MERLIIQGIQRLRVLTPCDYANMDELVHDLSNALEESSRSTGGRGRRGKCWKRRPKPPASFVSLGSSVPKSSPVSEDSESSLDDRMRCRMEINMTLAQSDSDELLAQNKNHLLSWRQCVASLVESDSVNENFLPSHPHRRKRKFKRMAVDPQQPAPLCLGPCLDLTSPNKPTAASVSPKPRKVKSIRAMKNKGKHSRYLNMDIENMCGSGHICQGSQQREGGSIASVFCGKRKRSMRERSLECARCDASEISVGTFLRPDSSQQGSSARMTHSFMDCDEILHGAAKCQLEASSSSLSSSESDGGLLTNDEGREADDEHSDFFHEAGPACGIPGVVNPWWAEESGEASFCVDDSFLDPEFKAILTGSMQHLSQAAQDAYHASISRLMDRAGREIRAGRRRLGKVRPSFSVLSSVNEKISKFMQDPLSNELKLDEQQYSDDDQLSHLATLYSLDIQREGRAHSQGVVLVKTSNTTQAVTVDPVTCKPTISDIKRRRRMPPNGTPIPAFGSPEPASPIPENNMGNLMLRNMGWEPGTGLGRDGQGIQVPLAACLRAKYQGLGFLLPPPKCTTNNNNLPQDEETILQAPTSMTGSEGLPPPPPPPSPQPPNSSSGGETTPQSESFDATSSLVIGHFQRETAAVEEVRKMVAQSFTSFR